MAATKLEDHPTVRAFRAGKARPPDPTSPRVLSGSELRRWGLAEGADDVGFVEITRPEIADQRA